MKKFKKFLVGLLLLFSATFVVGTVSACSLDSIIHIHEWGEWITVKEASCTETGKQERSCNLDPSHTQTKKIEVLGHEWGEWTTTKNATCTEKGEKTRVCTRDEKHIETDEIPVTHTLMQHEAVAATCTESGHVAYEDCLLCSYTTYKEIPALGHTEVIDKALTATCTTAGKTQGKHCSKCEEVLVQQNNIPALGHIEVIDKGVAATCVTSGRTDGKHCSVCEEVLVAQTPISALGHTEVIEQAVAATCTTAGKTQGKHCSECEEVLVAQKTIAALGHTEVIDKAVAATCTTAGKTQGKHCSECEEVLVAQKTVSALGHTEVIDKAVAATCTKAGKTQGKHCSECGEVLVAQTPISALGHTEVIDKAVTANCTTAGKTQGKHCSECEEVLVAQKTVAALGHTEVIDKAVAATCTTAGKTQGKHCSECGEVFVAQTVISALGHTEVVDEALAATCTESGKTQGKHCSVCNEILIAQQTIAALGHNYGEWTTVQNTSCTQNGIQERVCSNNSAHKETNVLPMTEHKVGDDGICEVCQTTINNGRLATPQITVSESDDESVTWEAIENVKEYNIDIIFPDSTSIVLTTTENSINLSQYFGSYERLKISVQAVAKTYTGYMNSHWSNGYTYEINGIPMASEYMTNGIGSTINAINGSLTEPASGADSIFDVAKFNNLRLEKVARNAQNLHVVSGDSFSDYSDKWNQQIDAKIGVGVEAKLLSTKLDFGVDLELNNGYTVTTAEKTKQYYYTLSYLLQGYRLEIKGYNNREKFSNMLSSKFLSDAKKVNDGEMTAEYFISLYGTHLITSGYFGASLDVQYSMVYHEEAYETETVNSIKAGITASISKIKVNTEVGSTESYLTKDTTSKSISKFNISAIGGGEALTCMDFNTFAAAYEKWASSISEDNYALIGVPDGSLFCIWDYLPDTSDYSTAKKLLNEYLIKQCQDNYAAIQDKVNKLAIESVKFDTESQVLTFDLSAWQKITAANLADTNIVAHPFTYDKYENNVLTITPAFNGTPIKKVVFKGNYLNANDDGETIKTKFEKQLAIKFSDSWTEDIEIEFVNFGYSAPDGYVALDLSGVQSKNVSINVVGAAYIQGGNGTSDSLNGCAGISAPNSNLTFTGNQVEVYGGDGGNGAKISNNNYQNGGNGGIGVNANNVTINVDNKLKVYGGNAGNGYNINCRIEGEANAGDGKSGYNGVSGGNGGVAINANSVTVSNGTLTAYGGSGGKGGDAGECNVAKKGTVRGGTGGTGGNGGTAISANTLTITSQSFTPTSLIGGNGGNSGKRGGCHSDEHEADGWFNDGKASDGYNGVAGNGGLAISSNCIVTDILNIIEAQDGSNGAVDTSLNQC